jgi:hypothetical protein
MSFEDLVGAIRAADGEDPELAAVTQLRLRRSLEVHARGRHRLAGIATAIAILFGGTVSWALATGRVTALWAPAPPPTAPEVAPPPAPIPAPHRRAQPRHEPVPAPTQDQVPAQTEEPVPAPMQEPELATVPGPALLPETVAPVREPAKPARQIVPVPVEVLYRKAHELHFHGGDPAATVAAWDAYLATEPDGRFSVDARYNRAIILVRLGRYAEARVALEPFARGEVEPEGYRQREAEQLVERLARYE